MRANGKNRVFARVCALTLAAVCALSAAQPVSASNRDAVRDRRLVEERETGRYTDSHSGEIVDDASTRRYVTDRGDGAAIAAVAQGEIGKSDSLEMPAGSNKVKYATWYLGQENTEELPWCCMFVMWCAQQCGLYGAYGSGAMFERTASCTTLKQNLLRADGAEVHALTACTTFGGSEYTPLKGDLIFYRNMESGDYDHVGIVIEVTGNSVVTADGNVPVTEGGGEGVGRSTINAAALERSARVRDGSIVRPAYPSNEVNIFSYLASHTGLNTAAVCGILANLYVESRFEPNTNEISGSGYGLMQWTDAESGGGEKTKFLEWCRDRGLNYSLLKPQLEYIVFELTERFTAAYSELMLVPDTAQGAFEAAECFCRTMERPANLEYQASYRGTLAMEEYWPRYGDGKKEPTVVASNLDGLFAEAGVDKARLTGSKLVVIESGGSSGILSQWEKSENGWAPVKENVVVKLGSHGVTARKSEGDRKTPRGLWPLVYAFGCSGNPGTEMTWKTVTASSVWVTDPLDPAYNTWQESEGSWSGARVLNDPQTFAYGVLVGYNVNPVVADAGSGIFLQCGSGTTSGSIALESAAMRELVCWLEDGAQILII